MTNFEKTFPRLHTIAEEDAHLVEILIEMFTQQKNWQIDKMEQALAEENGATLKVEAHTLKGVCLNLGLDALADTCLKMESTALEENFAETRTLLIQLEAQLDETLPLLEEFKNTLE